MSNYSMNATDTKMSQLFYVDDRFKNKIAYYHLLAFLISLPFDRFYSTIILLGFIVHSLLYVRKDELKGIGSKTFILQSVFFVTAISATYSDSNNGWDILTRQLAIFLFPLLFSIISLDFYKYRYKLLLAFSMCCTLVVAYLFFDAVHVIIHNKLPFKTLASAAFLNHHFSEPLNLHATYLSLYVLISLVFLLQLLFSELNKWHRIIFIISVVILLAGLLQLGSRAVCIAFLVVINIAPFFMLKGKKRLFFFLTAFLITFSGIALIASFDFLKERFIIDLKNDFEQHSNILKNDTRLQRWEASYNLILNAPIIGHGSGTETPLLKEIYFKRKMYSSYLNAMNVHNQYLSFLINSGVLGLLIYSLTLLWGFWQSFKKKDLLFFCFLSVIAIVSFSENLLVVNKGIFFYGFFFSFFIFSGKKNLPNNAASPDF
ncbi:MAG: O-antigen ligase family protein [Ferruginibacter sp.]